MIDPRVTTFLREARGSAAVEFTLWLALLIVPVLSIVDIGAYVFQKMQVQIASQAAVQYVWQKCDPNINGSPAFQNCSGLSAGITASAQSTTLGADITVTDVREGDACTKADSTLTWVGTPATAIPGTPTHGTCPAPSNGVAPGDYVSVTVSYPYKPIFRGLSVGSLLTTPITYTAITRLK